jgi:hypothetical protein
MDQVRCRSQRSGDGARVELMNEDVRFFRTQAERCRRLARTVSTRDVGETLRQMAEEYEERAKRLEAEGPGAPSPR